MSYMINLPQGGQSAMPAVQPGNSKRIVLSQPSQGNNNNGSAQTFPMHVMQVGTNNQPVILYQNSETLLNAGVQHAQSESGSTGSSTLAPVLLSPVSPVQNGRNVQANGNSPTITAMNMHPENNVSASRSLMEMFNVQHIAANPTARIQSANVPQVNAAQHHASGDLNSRLADILSSLQVGNFQIVEPV